MKRVPTIAELANLKLAEPVAWTKTRVPTHWRILPEGQRRVYEAMHENAIEMRNDPEKLREQERAAIVEYRETGERKK